jgi:alpha-1,2-mannosyltransferase
MECYASDKSEPKALPSGEYRRPALPPYRTSGPPHSARFRIWTRVTAFAILNGLVLGSCLWFLAARVGPSQTPGEGIALLPSFLLHKAKYDDSPGPMFAALECFCDDHLPIYQTVFFQRHTKFQYPLSSLVPLRILRAVGLNRGPLFYKFFAAASWAAVWTTIGVSLALFVRASRQNTGENIRVRGRILAFSIPVFIAALTFYPLLRAFELSQVQVFITALFCGALYCWLTERYRSAGALVALMTLLKPQYALFTIWFAFRKQFGALCANLAVLVLGGTATVVCFGWQEPIKYLAVLSFIAKRGETFYANQSINGLLNRALLHGDNLVFSVHSFAPYNAFVYTTTTVTSLLLIGLALWYPFSGGRRSKVEDLCTLAITATVASPIAWEHHYGILFPIFALLAGSVTRPRDLLWLAGSFVLVSHMWMPFQRFAGNPYLNVLESIPLFGVFLLLVFLYRTSLQHGSDRKVSFKREGVAADAGV